MKNQKVGLTAKNWMLSILGIIILSLVIILPPVFRVVFKEEVEPPVEEPVIPITTTTCYLENRMEENYTESETFIFEHRGTSIEQYTKRTEKTYTDPVIYETEKQSYGRLVTAFSILSGYRYSVTPNDDTLLVMITENYDLSNFEESMLVIPGDSEPTNVSSEYELHDSITQIQEELTTNGYVCTPNN